MWLTMAIVWLTTHYHDCPAEYAKKTVLGKPTNFHTLLVKIVDKYIDEELLSSSYQFSLSLSPCSNVELREFFNEIGFTWEKQNCKKQGSCSQALQDVQEDRHEEARF